MDHPAMIDRVVRWAMADENIRAVVLNGSVVRGEHDGLSVDKDDRAHVLVQLDPASASNAPTSAEFDECLNWFSAAALMQAKLIVRGELWLAKLRDQDLKAQLLRMIEWDHHSRHGWDTDTWYGGKRIGEWADTDVRADLEKCWAGSDPEHAVSALRASMRLFQRLALRTGTAMGFPVFHHERVQQEVDRILGTL